jgi:hypothetical protein
MKTLCLSFFGGVLVILKIVPANCRQALPDDRPIPLGQTHAAGRNNDVRASRSSRRRLGYPGSIDNHLILKCFMSKERDRVLVIC